MPIARRSRRRSNSSSAPCARPAPTSKTRGRWSGTLQQLGMPLYQCQPPTGYKDTADAWVNTGALVGRMNFALALASNRVRGVVVSKAPQSAADLISGELSESTRATIAKAAGAAADRGADAGLAGIPAEISACCHAESFSRTARSRWSAWASRRRSWRARRTHRAAAGAPGSSSRSFSAAPSTA